MATRAAWWCGALAWTSLAPGATAAAATDYETYVYLHGTQLAGGTVTLPAIRTAAFTFTGTTQTLDTAQFAFDSDYSTSTVLVADDNAGTTTTLWQIYSTTGTTAVRSLPHLPTAVKLMDIAGDTSSLSLVFDLSTYAASAPQPWEAIEQDLSLQTNTFADVVQPTPGDY